MNVVISGGGIAGLLLALALKEHVGITPTVYEQAPGYEDGVGGAVGMYPNGLRVIRDISPELLYRIRSQGKPFVHRKWMRHDGSIVATAEEKYLCDFKNAKELDELSSMGIRRWRLQKALVDECERQGIVIHLGRRINSVRVLPDNKVECSLDDHSTLVCDLLFGCDGVKSAIRTSLFGGKETEPKYTGITCLMGSAPIAEKSKISGICFASSQTSACHACYYPANDKEIIFQIFFPTEEKPETWKALTPEEGAEECRQLADVLKRDGWDPMFTDALSAANSVLRVGLRARNPIPTWHAPAGHPRIILLGDAAHPPVPYIGQGAMQAIEDVGVLSLLIKYLCKPTSKCGFNMDKMAQVVEFYERLRLPRTTMMLKSSQALGDMQLKRAKAKWFDVFLTEMDIWFKVKRHGTLPVMWNGSKYEYKKQVIEILKPKAKL